MSFISLFAIFFIVWWVTLFAILPVGVTTSGAFDERSHGTEGSAPDNPRLGLKMLLTTLIACAIVGLFYLLTVTYGWSVDDFPRIVPDFSREG